jgi:hypothetical protein
LRGRRAVDRLDFELAPTAVGEHHAADDCRRADSCCRLDRGAGNHVVGQVHDRGARTTIAMVLVSRNGLRTVSRLFAPIGAKFTSHLPPSW